MDSHTDLVSLSPVTRIQQPIFLQDWWIKTAAGGARTKEARVVGDNGDVVAKLPYIVLRLKGLPWGVAPYWTHLNGPIINKSLTGEETYKVVSQLLAQLPRGRSFNFIVPSTLENIEDIRRAFKDTKFEHFSRKTYLQMPAPARSNLAKMDSKHRGHFKTAAKNLELIEISAKEYIEFYESNIKAIGEKSHSPLEVAQSLIEAAQKRVPSQVFIFAARKKSDGSASPPLDAAVAILMDDTRAYLWSLTYRRAFPGQTQNKPNSDANKFLILEAVKYANEQGLIFDTDGLRNEGSEHLYNKILQFKSVEQHDMFERRTFSSRLFRDAKPLAVRAVARLRAGKSLLSRLTNSIERGLTLDMR